MANERMWTLYIYGVKIKNKFCILKFSMHAKHLYSVKEKKNQVKIKHIYYNQCVLCSFTTDKLYVSI